MSDKRKLPAKSWQPKIYTQREADALEALVAHFCTERDAEAVRHALRVFVRLVGVIEDDGCKLHLADVEGDPVEDAVALPREVYDYAEDESELLGEDEQRRWTVVASATDREHLADVRDWLSAASWRRVLSTVIVRIGELCAHLDDGELVLWAEPEHGVSYRMVLL
jgi:hypothetical protein